MWQNILTKNPTNKPSLKKSRHYSMTRIYLKSNLSRSISGSRRDMQRWSCCRPKNNNSNCSSSSLNTPDATLPQTPLIEIRILPILVRTLKKIKESARTNVIQTSNGNTRSFRTRVQVALAIRLSTTKEANRHQILYRTLRAARNTSLIHCRMRR